MFLYRNNVEALKSVASDCFWLPLDAHVPIFQFLVAASKFMRIGNLVCLMLLLAHWNGCLQWLVPLIQGFQSDSWIAVNELQVLIRRLDFCSRECRVFEKKNYINCLVNLYISQ